MKKYSEIIDSLKKPLVKPLGGFSIEKKYENSVMAFCENEAEVDFCLNYTLEKIDFLIALTPEAAAVCYLRNTSYLKLEDFYDVEFFSKLDEAMLVYQIKWASEINNFFIKKYVRLDECHFEVGSVYFFYLKVMIDTLLKAVFAIAHLFLSRPKKIIFFKNRRGNEILDDLSFPFSIYKETLSCFTKEKTKISCLKPQVKLKCPLWVRKTWRHIKRFFRSFLKDRRNILEVDLIYSLGFDTECVAEYAKKTGFRCTSMQDFLKNIVHYKKRDRTFRRILNTTHHELEISLFFKDMFFWFGVDFQQVVKKHIDVWFRKITPTLWEMMLVASEELQCCKPKAIFHYSPDSIVDRAIVAAARLLTIPVVTYQHGGFEGKCSYTPLAMGDLRVSDVRFVYGEGVATYFKKNFSCHLEDKKIIPIGSARLDSLNKKLDFSNRNKHLERLGVDPNKKVILYLPSTYRTNWYMAKQSYWEVFYFDFLIKVFSFFKKNEEFIFLYKPFPSLRQDPILSILESKNLNCKYVKEPFAPRLLEACDAFIFDTPDTGVLEACLTKKPILLLAEKRLVGLMSEARETLLKRVILVESEEEFFKKIEVFLSVVSRGECFEDRNFIKAYGTLNDDGCSVMRGCEVLRKVMFLEKYENCAVL